jgi:hypothetical protein
VYSEAHMGEGVAVSFGQAHGLKQRIFSYLIKIIIITKQDYGTSV